MNRREMLGIVSGLIAAASMSFRAIGSERIGYLRFAPEVIDEGDRLKIWARVSDQFGEHVSYALGAIKGPRTDMEWTEDLRTSMDSTLARKYTKLILPDGSEYTSERIERIREFAADSELRPG